jgi:Nif-specific regulatory protein
MAAPCSWTRSASCRWRCRHKLLRTLQEGTLVRLGGAREIQTDVRLVAATSRELGCEVQSGRFRQDLYCRLNVIPIRLPSQREWREDV